MDGDPRNQRLSLLKKYDMPVENLSYEYVNKCTNKKELERIIRILRSGEEGSYPDLLKVAEDRLRVLAPDSRVLRVETPILTKEFLGKEEWDKVENELLCWEEEMNVVDKCLDFEKSRIDVLGNKNLPEVRKVEQQQINSKSQEKSKVVISNNKSGNNSNNNQINNKRIKSGDYEAWDKFDVDKELLKIDVEEERKQELNEKEKRKAKKSEKEKKIDLAEVDKENYSSMEQQVLANQAKDRGNECYKSGDFKSALKYYEISINLYSTANSYNNRAMTYIKLKQYDKAIEDCNKVLSLEKNNVKALLRRATAYQNMEGDKENLKYNELALKDLYEIIQLEPNNKVAQADIQKLKKKLNIEDSGKKFRMSISDGSINTVKSATERNSTTVNTKDNTLCVDKLPLTYYGPSTSTFQCEPYSMIHHALSGSSIPGRVLCKCNSNIPKQNPLCQKCGEALCTPKPLKAIKGKSEVKVTEEKNKENLKTATKVPDSVLNVKSESDGLPLLKSKASDKNDEHKEENLSVENQKETVNKNVNEIGKNEVKGQTASEKAIADLPSDRIDNSKKEICVCEPVSKKTGESHVKEVVAESKISSKGEEILEAPCNKNNDTPTASNNSSQNEVSHSSKKSKNKKKKSKKSNESKTVRKHLEPIKMEPVKVVYANKYLHPTSVEPKVRSEPAPSTQKDSNICNTTQFKEFVPNRKCYSTELKRTDPPVAKVVPSPLPEASPPKNDQTNYDSSSEGNKENISENNRTNKIDNETKDEGDDFKKDVIDTPYKFTKAWEALKKLDESYVKRAEIIRKIQPTDLSKVIGIKLDSEMLSCILECLLRHVVETEPKRVVELLKQLPQIPRFNLVSMFLADNDVKKIQKLIQAAEDRGFKLEEDTKKSLTALR